MTNDTFGLTDDQIPSGELFYCGARALATVTGKTGTYINEWIAALRVRCADSTRMMKKTTDSKHITTTWWDELLGFLVQHGFKPEVAKIPCSYVWVTNRDRHGFTYIQRRNCKPSLSKWVRETAKVGETYIVRVTGHFLVVRNRRVYDYNGQGLPVKNHHYAKVKVTDYITL